MSVRFATSNLIAGEWVPSRDRSTIAVHDPATDAVLAEVPAMSAGEVRQAVDAAYAAFPDWSQRAAPQRRRVLRQAVALIEDHAEDLARLVTAENGKPLSEARAEISYGLGFLDFAADEACRIYGETIPASVPGKRIFVGKRPVGVTAAITPWNFPFAMLTRKLGPALATGCTQVVKPASETPLTALALADLMVQAGVPAGVLNVVTTRDGATFGETVLADERVRKVSFTGSTGVGQWLVQRAAANMTRLSLELGGHAPLIVLDDADIDQAVAGAMRAKFRNTGQSCIAANRLYVARDIYAAFCDRFAAAAEALSVGVGESDADIGPLIHDRAVEKVSAHVEDALNKGGRLLCGGKMRHFAGLTNRFFEPTVIADATDDMLAFNEETFGPVAVVAPFDTDAEAIGRANSLPFGLAAYVFGSNGARLLRVVEQLDAGVVGVNDGVPSTAQAPFGGLKLSGLGREGGKYVMDEYLDTKYISYGIE